MWDQDEPYQEDHLAVGKGIVYGVLLGGLLWAIIIGTVVVWLK